MRDAPDNAREALKILRGYYAGRGKPRIINLYATLTSLQKTNSESVTDYIIRAETTITALRNAGGTLGDGLLIAMVLKGLPEMFRPFAIHVAHNDDNITFPEFRTKLRSFEDTDKLSTTESSDNVMKTQARPGRRPAKQGAYDGNSDNADIECFKCGTKGHRARVCRQKMVVTLITSSGSKTEKTGSNFDDTFKPETHCVELADGTRCNGVAQRKGEAEVCLVDSGGRRHTTTLRKALFIPSYPQDIFSVKAATASGATVVFKQGKDALIHKDGTRFDIHVSNRLYYLHTEGENSDKCNACHDVQTWHEILGHCNYDDVLQMQNVVEGMQIKGKTDRPDQECEVGNFRGNLHKPEIETLIVEQRLHYKSYTRT
ncbi:uncharacterized protein LOC117556386 [Gymnodraco acuticeps]|uniref:Uncharacterized protein LOC117556386 n=1 Tax=Gymnodraco acuticeps TaxID=8218 RepID=A0A6P8WJH1_GYMAC|nr:uncharacterized protein LOC117556386 [Gymnodraco acuticeps]